MNKHKSQSGSAHLIIIIVLVIALVGTLGFVFWQNFIKPKADEAKPIHNSSSQKTTTSKVASKVDPTLGWKTYTNTSLGFSFKYPSDWTLIPSQGGTPASDFVSLVSPNIAAETKGMIDAPNIDIGVSSANKSSVVADDTTPAGVKALLLHQEGKDTSSYYSQQYSETINSLTVNEFDMAANPPFFDAVFPVGDNYVDMAFLTTQTKSDLSTTSGEILSSFKAN